MSEKIITITIDKNGDSTVDLEGFHGKGCEAVANAFKMGKVTNQTHKPAYNEPGPGTGVTVGH